MLPESSWPMATLVVVAAVTALTRGLPYVALRGRTKLPPVVEYLGTVLPGAIMVILVFYCLRHVQFHASPFGLPECMALASVAVIHRVGRNQFLSVFVGTVIYMVLLWVIR